MKTNVYAIAIKYSDGTKRYRYYPTEQQMRAGELKVQEEIKQGVRFGSRPQSYKTLVSQPEWEKV